MPAPFHVNGQAGIYLSGALAGYGVDGADIEDIYHHKDVKWDVSGGSEGSPGDVQILSAETIVSVNLVAWDWVVINTNLGKSQGGVTAGTMPASGILLGASGNLFELLIVSPLEGYQRRWPTAYIMSPTRRSVGTVHSIMPVVIRAFPYAGGSDSLQGKVLYTTG